MRRRNFIAAPVWSLSWRDRATTSPACQFRWPTLLANGLKSYARSYPVCAGWGSWPMPAIPSVSGSWARYRAPPLARRLDWLHGKEMRHREARDFADIFRARRGFRPDVERQLTDGRRPMQFILIVVTIAAATLFDVRPSEA